LRSGAVDGLSIGFRTKRASTDKQSGVRRLLEVDLWEISIVTFPMLQQARIETVKRRRLARPVTMDVLSMKLTRIKAHRAAERFETKLRLLSHALERRYSPAQPRLSAGSREAGRWTRGRQGASSSSTSRDLGKRPGARYEYPADVGWLNCDQLYESDSAICRALDSKIQRANDWASAADPMAACIGGGPILPFQD
jgi:hypothetical protein